MIVLCDVYYIYIYVNSDICDVWMLGSYESAMWFTDWWPKIEAKFAVKAFKLRGVSKEKEERIGEWGGYLDPQ